MDNVYIPLFAALAGALIGAAGSVTTIMIQANIANRRAMSRQAAELALAEFKVHIEVARDAGSRGRKVRGISPPYVYFRLYMELLRSLEKNEGMTANEIQKILDDHIKFDEMVHERDEARRSKSQLS